MAWSLDLGKLIKPLGDFQDWINRGLNGGDQQKVEEARKQVERLNGTAAPETETQTEVPSVVPDKADIIKSADAQTANIAAGLSGMQANKYGSQGRAQSAAYGSATGTTEAAEYVTENKQTNRDKAFLNAVNAGQQKLTAAKSSLDADNLATAAELSKQAQSQQDFANILSNVFKLMGGGV